MIDDAFTRDIRVHFCVVCGSSREPTRTSPDFAPSLYNPTGKVRHKVKLSNINNGLYSAFICLDGFDCNPIDQTDTLNCARFPTFYSDDLSTRFWL